MELPIGKSICCHLDKISSWSPGNIQLRVENAEGQQLDINVVDFIGTACQYFVNPENGEPRSKEEHLSSRVFILGCNENTTSSRRQTLGPIIKKAKGGFQVSAKRGYHDETSSITYYVPHKVPPTKAATIAERDCIKKQ